MKPNRTRHKSLSWLIALVILVAPITVIAADEQEYQRIEPNEYVQKQIEMNLSKYAEQNNRSASSLPEEQLILTFQQEEQQAEDDLWAELFISPISSQASLLNEVERYDLFAEAFSTRSTHAENNESGGTVSISVLLIGAVIALVALLFIWVLPKLNEESK
ncbi:type VII secretion protein EssA [Alkalicoccobacillus porphyridii]|uniref:Type VII secretion protein EssA n=1 Tax=Alkalicoccobacillus porphyridii TaxID=2597270 RepID=A0A553ZTU6_9BACI|nr:type VII secretion protein EssA [Alkalicoccobacillus porphyridii]TSB44900.1 type VII secretion protein EssA [Alkalicoccobacillus porphyridii]